jgi:hypothetical protein
MAYALTEEPLDMARRHLRQAEGLVARQQALIEQLRGSGHIDLVPQAQTVLDNLRISLALAHADLAGLSAPRQISRVRGR